MDINEVIHDRDKDESTITMMEHRDKRQAAICR